MRLRFPFRATPPPALAEPPPPRHTVLVLSGGAGRGAAQLGVLHALADHGIAIDAVVGTSVGALNGAIIAAKTLAPGVALLDDVWASPYTKALFQFDLRHMLVNRLHRNPSLHSHHALTNLIDHVMADLDITKLEDCPLPLYLLLTDLSRGESRVVHHGPLRLPLLASCSAPGLFPPVAWDQSYFADGAITQSCSLATAAGLHPTHIIAIDLMRVAPLTAPLRRFSDTLDRVAQIATHDRTLADFAQYQKTIPITLLCTAPGPSQPPFAELVHLNATARQSANRLLEKIQDQTTSLPAPGVFYLD